MDSGDVLNVTLSDDYDGPVKSYDTEELKKWKGSDCYRECDDKDKGRICYFDWTLEFWNVYGVWVLIVQTSSSAVKIIHFAIPK